MEIDGTSARTGSMPSLGATALALAAKGIPVFPLKPGGKLPVIPKSEGGSGFYDATTDAATIRQWWKRWPRANIGMPTGILSGMIVVEIDPRHGGTLDGLTELGGPMPDTLLAQSGGGGWHFFLRHPGGIVKGRKLFKSIEDADAYELKSDGGYVVLAPSIHPNGNRYAWQNHIEAAEMPGWLSRLIAQSDIDEETSRERVSGPVSAHADDAAHWLEWAMRQRETVGDDKAGMLLAVQLLVNDVLDAESVLLDYAERAARNPAWPFTGKDVQRWLTSAAHSRIVQGGEKARGRTPKPSRPRPIRPDVAQEPQKFTDDLNHESLPPEPEEAVAEHCTDLGNARRLIRRHGHHLRYVAQWGSWLVWDGRRWKRDETGAIYRRAKDTVRSIYAEASECEDSDERKEIIKWAARSEAQARIEALIACAQTEPEVACTSDAFDANGWLLTCLNGTLDLRTGQLRAHRQTDLITKLAPIAYDPDAKAPLWDAFLARIMGGNVGLISFLARAVGYTLTGDISEQVLFLLYGQGANGKSKLLEAMEGVLGDYGIQTPTSTLMYKATDNSIPNDVARLKGTRFVKAIETEDGKRLAEALVKQMTGGDMISARFMRAEWFDFKPTFKIWLAANHKPIIRGTDDGIWRRIRCIPFLVQIPPAEQDKQLTEKLQAEYPGILAWAVRGCLEWRRIGLETPKEVQEATQGYRQEMDALGTFIEERCVVGARFTAPVGTLYATYESWCEDAGERPISKRIFGLRMVERGYIQEKSTGGLRQWTGIGKKDDL